MKDSYENPSTNNRGRSLIDLDNYKRDAFDIHGFALRQVLDDVILVEYVDTNDCRDVMRNGIVLPSAHINHIWRIAVVHLAGPNCKLVKIGDHVCFPSDKGLPVSGINIVNENGNKIQLKAACFLSESRIFGVCTQLDISNDESVASILNDSSAK